jgi:hypothetical protein
VQPEHSIQTRLYTALVNLHAEAPLEGWNLFYDHVAGTVMWNRVIASGFSQGAGHAAFLAYEQRVARTAFLSGPEDCCSSTSFMSRPWATPNDRLTAWYHNEEDLRGAIEANLAQRGMSERTMFVPGALSADLRLDGLHLYTRDDFSDTCPSESNREFHYTSTLDSCAPRNTMLESGYAYEPVWQLMVNGAFAADVPAPVVLTAEQEALAAAEDRANNFLYALIATGACLGLTLGYVAFTPKKLSDNQYRKGLLDDHDDEQEGSVRMHVTTSARV